MGVPYHGRAHPDLHQLIGYFVNPLAMRVSVDVDDVEHDDEPEDDHDQDGAQSQTHGERDMTGRGPDNASHEGRSANGLTFRQLLERVPCSYQQEQMLILHHMEAAGRGGDGSSLAYSMPFSMRLRGALDKRALRRSVGAAVTTRRGSHGTLTGALQLPSGCCVRTRLVVAVVVVVV